MTESCEVCGKEVKNYDPKICCSSFDCGCGGNALEPPICSSECWDALMSADTNVDDFNKQ